MYKINDVFRWNRIKPLSLHIISKVIDKKQDEEYITSVFIINFEQIQHIK